MSENPRILCVHQGGELYGSDRIFLQSVEAMRSAWPHASIKVVLAADGPLRGLLEGPADEVVVRPLGVLRLANPLLTLFKMTLGLPYFAGKAAMDIAAADVAYINTTVIADFQIAARFFRDRCVVHAHEIPKRRAMPVIRSLLKWSRAHVIMNSRATCTALALPDRQATALVYNGAAAVENPQALELPGVFTQKRPLRLAMLGRLSNQKAQDLLIDAIALLPKDDAARLRLRIVGSAYLDREEPVRELEAQIGEAGLEGVVTLEPFTDDPREVYRWADICVIPSRLPESFGMVAIEAMAEARTVIASAHGGPVEIVIDGETGWLVEPDNASALADAIAAALADPVQVRKRADASLRRFDETFSSQSMAQSLRDTLSRWFAALA